MLDKKVLSVYEFDIHVCFYHQAHGILTGNLPIDIRI